MIKYIYRNLVKTEGGVQFVLAAYQKLYNGAFPLQYEICNNHSFPIFHIVSAGRSGTTLLRILLNQHPNIYIPLEFWHLRRSILIFIKYNRTDWDSLCKELVHFWKQQTEWDFETEYVLKECKNIPQYRRDFATLFHVFFTCTANQKLSGNNLFIGDKTPLNFKSLFWINKIQTKPKVIHMVRDGRDVVHSLVENKLQATIIEAANRWMESLRNTENYQKKYPSQLLTIHYESLVRNPKDCLDQICKFLELDQFEFEVRGTNKKYKDSDLAAIPYHTNVFEPVASKYMGKYKQGPYKKEIDDLPSSFYKYLSQFNYI